MRKIKLTDNNFADSVAECGQILARPGSVAMTPTETVYGLVCRWNDQAAINRIYELKGRGHDKPLAMFADTAATLAAAGGQLSRAARQLFDAFCPGPVTLIIPNKNGGTLGFRMPDYPFVLKLLAKTGFPLASTSANRSGDPNARSVEEALTGLTGEPDIVIDAGQLPPGRLASTVIDATAKKIKILRSGPVSEAQIQSILRQ